MKLWLVKLIIYHQIHFPKLLKKIKKKPKHLTQVFPVRTVKVFYYFGRGRYSNSCFYCWALASLSFHPYVAENTITFGKHKLCRKPHFVLFPRNSPIFKTVSFCNYQVTLKRCTTKESHVRHWSILLETSPALVPRIQAHKVPEKKLYITKTYYFFKLC